MSYQGWTNRATWCVNLWLENDEPLYREFTRLAKRADDIESLAERMHERVRDMMPELDGLWADLLGFAIEETDWYELAKAWKDAES